MIKIAAIYEHVYKRWQEILTCMIQKDPGSAKIHRLQVLHLYEWDFNLLLGLFLRELDQHCEDNKLINKEPMAAGPTDAQ